MFVHRDTLVVILSFRWTQAYMMLQFAKAPFFFSRRDPRFKFHTTISRWLLEGRKEIK